MPSATAIHDLPALTWQGTKLYASSIRTSWSHRQAEREYFDVPGAAHDWTGRKALSVSAEVHFLNTIEEGLFPTKWQQFRASMLKGEIGTLRHPDIGIFNARVTDTDFTITAESTAGVSVQVTWTESIKSADQPTEISASSGNAAAEAAVADAAIEALGISYPSGMQEPSFGAMIGALESFGTLLENQISGKFNDAIATVDRMYNLLQSDCKAQQGLSPVAKEALAGSAYRFVLEKSLDSIRAILVSAKELAEKHARTTATYTTTSDSTIATISLEIPADINGLVTLNPALLAVPIVPKGSVLTYYTD